MILEKTLIFLFLLLLFFFFVEDGSRLNARLDGELDGMLLLVKELCPGSA